MLYYGHKQNNEKENEMDKQRVNDVAYELADYGIFGAGADHGAYQQEWGALCVEAAILLMEGNGLTEITYQSEGASTKYSFSIDELKLKKDELIKNYKKYLNEGWY